MMKYQVISRCFAQTLSKTSISYESQNQTKMILQHQIAYVIVIKSLFFPITTTDGKSINTAHTAHQIKKIDIFLKDNN